MTVPTPFHRGGEGPPLVLLHGFTGSWRIWARTLPSLQDEHDVLALSLPGHAGGVPLPPDAPPTVATLADLVERDLDAHGIDRAHLAGNSLGGWLALELGRRGRALSVTALSPAGGWNGPKELRRLTSLMRRTHAQAARTPRLVERAMGRRWSRRAGLRLVAEHGERVPPAEAVAMLRDARACALLEPFLTWAAGSDPLSPPERDADHPTTIAWAAHDRVLPFERYGRPLLENVGPARLVTLPGVGHVPMLDDPALVAHTILTTTRRVEHRRKAEAA